MSNLTNRSTLKIGVIPGRISEISLENGITTVEQALIAADLQIAGYEVRVNGQIVPLETVVSNGDTVLLVKKIKGN